MYEVGKVQLRSRYGPRTFSQCLPGALCAHVSCPSKVLCHTNHGAGPDAANDSADAISRIAAPMLIQDMSELIAGPRAHQTFLFTSPLLPELGLSS